jgi:N6-adenosine-specific RNA methylase IME4
MSTRKGAETAWLATRGKGLPRLDKHSDKPDEAYRRLEQLYGGTNRLDMFARRPRPGWRGWGAEAA